MLASATSAVYVVYCVVEVEFYLVEVPVVVVGDFGWDISLADPVHVLGRDVQRPYDRVKAVVYTGDDFFEVTLMFAGIRASGEFSFNGGLREHVGIGYECVYVVYCVVEVEFYLVEVPVVAVGEFWVGYLPC